jgi:hypothetical protein
MIGNLETHEVVHGFEGFLVVGGNGDAGAAREFLQIPVKVSLQTPHGSGAGDILAVDQHRRVEVSVGEHAGDVLEVPTNLTKAGGVLNIIDADFDQTAVGGEDKVVGGLLMREAHDLIAVLVERGLTVRVLLAHALMAHALMAYALMVLAKRKSGSKHEKK